MFKLYDHVCLQDTSITGYIDVITETKYRIRALNGYMWINKVEARPVSEKLSEPTYRKHIAVAKVIY